jgi:glycine cleavage system H protein
VDLPSDLKYTKEHEWIRLENGEATIGITDYAQGELGDIVYLELPSNGTAVKQMEPFGTIEAVKAVSELFSPVSGEITDVNKMIEDDAGVINRDPYGDGWMIKVKLSKTEEVENLLSAEQYKEMVEEL